MHIMKAFFDALEDNGILYVHFKSNPNLEYSFHHTGDFDVLVDPLRQRDVCEVLCSFRAKQMNTTNDKRYPGVDNWLFFDPESGRIHHLHLHYQLMSGKAFVKEYEIPWRELLLQSRIRDEDWGIFIADPALELILLNVRTVIKSHASDRFKACIGAYHTHPSLQQERTALLKTASGENTETFLAKLFAPDHAAALKEIVSAETLGSKEFRRLSGIVRKDLSLQRRYSGVKASWLSAVRTLRHYWRKAMRKLGSFELGKKTSMSKGAIFAFVGVDGSGKSTTSKEIYKWLSKQFDCVQVYMGLGDGKTTPLVYILKTLRKAAGPASESVSINSAEYKKRDPVSFVQNPKLFIRKRLLISALYSVEKANYRKIVRMHRYRINGGISILDRYPQIELPNKNDGPKIGAYRDVIKADSLISRMEAKEARRMSIVKTVRPDIVFRLNISAEESMRRKTDQTDISVVRGKIDDLRSIGFQGARIVDIDAAQSYEDELTEIKKAVWEYL